MLSRKFIIVSLLVVNGLGVTQGATFAQMKKMAKLPKQLCMSKNSVTEAEVGDIDKGNFVETRSVMCYIACIYQSFQMVKNGKLNFDAAIKQVETMFPDDVREATKEVMLNCKESALSYKDACDAAFHMAKCLYDMNPKIFFFP